MSTTKKVAHEATQAENAQTEVKAPMSVVKEATAAPVAPLSIEERLKRHADFSNLVSRYKMLDDKLVELSGFLASGDGNGESVTLRNAAGRTVVVGNSTVIAEIIDLLIIKTEAAKAETGAKLQAFEI
jgi:hypothetical protein